MPVFISYFYVYVLQLSLSLSHHHPIEYVFLFLTPGKKTFDLCVYCTRMFCFQRKMSVAFNLCIGFSSAPFHKTEFHSCRHTAANQFFSHSQVQWFVLFSTDSKASCHEFMLGPPENQTTEPATLELCNKNIIFLMVSSTFSRPHQILQDSASNMVFFNPLASCMYK